MSAPGCVTGDAGEAFEAFEAEFAEKTLDLIFSIAKDGKNDATVTVFHTRERHL